MLTRRVASILAAAGLIAAGTIPAAHGDSWYPKGEQGLISHVITDSFAAYSAAPMVLAEPDSAVAINMRGDGTPADMSKDVLCTSYAAAPCNSPTTGFNMRVFLPPCSATITEWCVEGLALSMQSSNLTTARLIRSTSGQTFAADPNRGLPATGTVSLWQAVGVQHTGGTDTYAVSVQMDAGKLSTAQELWIYGMTASVLPYTETTDGYFEAPAVRPAPDRRPLPIEMVGGGENCAWTEDGRCGRRQDFTENTRVNLQLRLGNSITGWLNGRLSEPEIAITSLSARQNLVSVTATSVVVPQIAATLTASQWAEIEQKNPGVFAPGGGGRRADDWPSVGRQVPALVPYLKDTASGVINQWSFATTGSRTTDPCLRDTNRLVGLVTTNAAIYESGAPGFTNGFLEYRVGGMHYLPDGKVAVGIYDLYMRSDAARCLYKYSSAPLSAVVSVTGSGGEQRVATTTLNETNGWLHLRAAGFDFSTKTIRVKLSGQQLKPAAKIKCRKGSKVVSLALAKCPAGYVKVK